MHNTYDLRQMQALMAINRTGSYTAAAEMLGYSQPAVSYQMRQLQRIVGTRLVIQTSQGARLTHAGKALVRHAEVIFAAMRAAAEELTTLAALGGPVVRIDAFQSICAALIPRAVEHLGSAGNDVRIVLHQAEPTEARSNVRHGEADIALLAMWDNEPLPEGEAGMRRIPLMSDRRCVVMRGDHPLADRETIDFADLAGEAWIIESFRDHFVTACRENGFEPKVAAIVDDYVTGQALVCAGLGISLANELGLQVYLEAGLAVRALRDWPRRVLYALVWPGMAGVPAVAATIEAVQAAARGLRVSIPGSEVTARPGFW
jgi:DNA-binding transcriptional LysR family regulator